ncbi:cytochrome P450 [Geodermatophilus sp. SYSU D01036]
MTLSRTHGPSVDLDLAELYRDPYPVFRRLRREAPVAYVPAAGRYLVTREADVVAVDRDPEVFSSMEPDSLMHRVMGETLLRKDGAAHRRERVALEAPLKPRTVRDHWTPVFQANADDLIDDLVSRGEADLFTELAAPLAARNLAAFLGLGGVAAEDLIRWSQDLMAAMGNYQDDPEIWARAFAARDALGVAVDEVIERVRAVPDHSVISAMVNAEDPLTVQQVHSNVMVVVGGGLNEPRDALLTATYALLTHPAQRRDVEADPALWKRVFEEAVRWVSPIGMYPRRVTRPVELGGVQLEAGDRLGIVVSSANRDESVHPRPDEFDLHRADTVHYAFGGGPHYCAGTWVARASIGQIGLPTLFRRLPGLALDPAHDVPWGGWVFRGPLSLRVRWDA